MAQSVSDSGSLKEKPESPTKNPILSGRVKHREFFKITDALKSKHQNPRLCDLKIQRMIAAASLSRAFFFSALKSIRHAAACTAQKKPTQRIVSRKCFT